MSFAQKVLPGNYNLTKSMEISKIQSSGTLWYTKKFLVLYNIIFLTNKLETIEYIDEINERFQNYIDSINYNIQDNAKKFFFNGENHFSIENTKTYNNFIDKNIEFDNLKEKNRFENISKKYYFAYLMGSGGQSGIKKHIRNNLYSEDFKFSIDALKKLILDFNKKNNLNHDVNTIINDYIAFIRNERQILYYFGYFHSKTTGAKDLEFSSLTPIGELAYLSNYKEFHLIWEHQKLKMISQPINVKINNINNLKVKINPNNFGINTKPYFDILKFLKTYNRMSKKEYKYIVSRNKNKYDIFHQDKNYLDNLISNIDAIKGKVENFGRKRDLKSEDFNKELKKYTLGILSNMPLDRNTNTWGILKDGYEIKISDKIKFNKVYNIYKLIEQYKSNKYNELFIRVEKELKNYYKFNVVNKHYRKDKVIKAEWNLYNGQIDGNIIFALMILSASLEEDIQICYKERKKILKYLIKTYPIILKYFSLNKKQLEDTVNTCIKDIENGNLSYNLFNELNDQFLAKKYEINNLSDIEHKIKKISNKESYINLNRKRNNSLINLMKVYYRKKYDTFSNYELLTTNIKCECCGNQTFINSNRLPYMEFHHIIPFGQPTEGQDHYLNLINLCPNCHSKIHNINRDEKRKLYDNINNNNYMNLNIKERLLKLKKQGILKSYQLEFLYSEDAISKCEYDEIGGYYNG